MYVWEINRNIYYLIREIPNKECFRSVELTSNGVPRTMASSSQLPKSEANAANSAYRF